MARAAAAIGILAACALACASQAPAPPAGASWEAVSASGRLLGRFAPESGEVEVGRFQTWSLELRTAQGQAVSGAAIVVGGGMPGHGHGLPTQPRVTSTDEAGRYRVEGVQLNMYGAWVFVFDVRTSAFAERLRFDLDVDY